VFTSISSFNESIKPHFKEPVEAQVGLRLPGVQYWTGLSGILAFCPF